MFLIKMAVLKAWIVFYIRSEQVSDLNVHIQSYCSHNIDIHKLLYIAQLIPGKRTQTEISPNISYLVNYYKPEMKLCLPWDFLSCLKNLIMKKGFHNPQECFSFIPDRLQQIPFVNDANICHGASAFTFFRALGMFISTYIHCFVFNLQKSILHIGWGDSNHWG